MDIDGVDADYLSNNEILELLDDVIDNNEEEILILDNIDVKNLEDDKLLQIYDDVLYSSEKVDISKIVNNLTDIQVLDINKNIVDVEDSEIIILNGTNINIDSLSDEEISSLYDEASLDEPVFTSDNYGYHPVINTYGCTATSLTSYFISGYGTKHCTYVTCPTTDTAISTTGSVSFSICKKGDSYTMEHVVNSINNYGELYLTSYYSSAGYKVIGTYVHFFYKYYNPKEVGGVAHIYIDFAQGYDTGAK